MQGWMYPKYPSHRNAFRPYLQCFFVNITLLIYSITWPSGKSKSFPRQADVAQGVPGRLRPRIFLTFRQHKDGKSSAKGTGRLYPRRNLCYSLSEAESTSGHMDLSGVPRKRSLVTPLGFDLGTVRLVAQCLNHYATPGINTILFSPFLCVKFLMI